MAAIKMQKSPIKNINTFTVSRDQDSNYSVAID